MSPSWSKIALAEAIGVFALVFIGVLAISGVEVTQAREELTNLTSVAFAHGLVILVMVAALSGISGGHFNPAVTLGFVVTGRLSLALGAVYWIAQLVGGTVAALLLVALFGRVPVAAGTPDLGLGVSFMAGVVLETVATFILVLVVFGTAVDGRAPKGVFPLAIGLAIVLNILAIGPLTGGAINPARAFGPALASWHWNNQLVYWIGPLLGGCLAGWVEHFILMERAPSPEVATHGGPAPSEKRGNPPTAGAQHDLSV